MSSNRATMLLTAFCLMLSHVATAFLVTPAATTRIADARILPRSTALHVKAEKRKRPRQNHEKWQPFFDKLSQYKDENGHCQ
eukprot:CAMPEP_0198132316 /NCGR_PEP_ID=MMETSP1442-20131203/58068_1 /TAXON_ID= /ORGANISM="Craspedostauros australis, Strain CCMP3328" /LENGTH=81 /DNA_ID=CAMNT_0043793295 /DNA_START=88 /DNA_END=330 /DNA_ORIENTATION=-